MKKMEEKKKVWKDFTFKLFGTTWKVHFVEFIPLREDEPEGEVHWGNCNDNNDTITIALGTPNGYKFSDRKISLTLLHELSHAICGTGNYKITNDEPFIEWMGRCWMSLIEQNVIDHVC